MLTTLLALLAVFPAVIDDETDDPATRHKLAPRHVSLHVTEGTRLVAADADDGHDEEDDYAPALFARLSEQHPGRFRFDEEAEHWVDAQGEYEWDDEDELYWQNVSAETLTHGRQDYVQFCASCHGFQGDGYGRSAQTLRPPPRDFRAAQFKFAKITKDLPDDDALMAIVKGGLDGTPMYEWDISDERLADIITYVKSLSPAGDPENDVDPVGWRDPYAQIGAALVAGDDPWAGKESAAVEAGEQLYHKYQCYNCHPGYGSAEQLNGWRDMDAGTEYPDDLTYPKLRKDSSYEVMGYGVAIVPPDFTWHAIRRGRTVEDVYLTIAAGLPGSGMPTWKGAVPDEDIWAIAHYVRHLVDSYKDQPARAAFMAGIRR